MHTLQEYKCPCCGGAIKFDTAIQAMKCPYCDNEYSVDTLRSYDEELKRTRSFSAEWDTNAGKKWDEVAASELCTYICNSCGGEIVTDSTTAATTCPYCGNPVVIMKQFAGDLCPDYVIPFKLDEYAAKTKLLQHVYSHQLVPGAFRVGYRIKDIKGVYVPFWLFDADINAHITYNATEKREWFDGSLKYTEKSYYLIIREGNVDFRHIPVDGSSKMPDDLMESLEPYDFSEAVDFKTAYLSGFFAEKYDVSAADSIDRANERVRRSAEQSLGVTAFGYDTLDPQSSEITVKDGKTHYALFPVWILNTRWKGKDYTFAMNGQTGKFIGDLPCDEDSATLWTLWFALLFTAGFFILLWLIVFLGYGVW